MKRCISFHFIALLRRCLTLCLQVGRFLFEGFGATVVELPVYLVAVQIHDLPPQEIRAVVGEREPYMLLGRNILSSYRVLLDGPRQAVEIELPA
jgi:hypothetical protein